MRVSLCCIACVIRRIVKGRRTKSTTVVLGTEAGYLPDEVQCDRADSKNGNCATPKRQFDVAL